MLLLFFFNTLFFLMFFFKFLIDMVEEIYFTEVAKVNTESQ